MGRTEDNENDLAKITLLFANTTASELELKNIKLARRTVQDALLAASAAKTIDENTQEAMTSMIDACSNLDESLLFLHESVTEALSSANAATEVAFSAHDLIYTSKKAIDDFSLALSSAAQDLDFDQLRGMAELAASSSSDTLNEIKQTVTALRETVTRSTAAKVTAFVAKEAAKVAQGNALLAGLAAARASKSASVDSAAAAKAAAFASVKAADMAAKKAAVAASIQVLKATAKSRALALANSEQMVVDLANKAKSSFLANMSHELRTPLSAIIGFAEIITNDINEKVPTALLSGPAEAILRNSRHLFDLINDIMDISKIDSGLLEAEKMPVLIQEELKHIAETLKEKARQRGNGIEIECNANVPVTMNTDPTKLRQILMNLVSNAIKFTEQGVVKISLDVIRQKPNNAEYLRFRISDTGIGIGFADQAKLFKSYSQADQSTSRQFGGTGLGLMLARKMARFLGGDAMLISSAVGKGSLFQFNIPLNSAASISKPKNDVGAVPPSSVQSIQGCLVLLAEDSPDMQNIVGNIITSRGGQVDIAANGEDAVDKAQKSDYDLILMDVQMPVLDGNEANKKLRKMGIKIPIIAFTAHALINKDYFSDAIYDGYLSKPVTKNALIQTINRWYQPE